MNNEEINEQGNKAIQILKEIIKLDNKMLEQNDYALDCMVFNHIYEARLLLNMNYPKDQNN